MSINVPVYNEAGEQNIVLCNQLHQLPVENLIEFQYMISDSDMLSIERGVLVAYQMEKYLKNYELMYTFDQLKSVIQGIVNSEVNRILNDRDSNKVTADDIRGMVTALIPEEYTKSKVEIEESTTVAKSVKPRHQRRKWTPDVVKSYLSDFGSLSKTTMMKKYNLKDESAVGKYASYCKKLAKTFNIVEVNQ